MLKILNTSDINYSNCCVGVRSLNSGEDAAVRQFLLGSEKKNNSDKKKEKSYPSIKKINRENEAHSKV